MRVSVDGGREPLWSSDGRELFYRRGDRMLVVPVAKGSEPAFGRPTVLFTGRYATRPRMRNYDVAPDGSRFLMVRDDHAPPGSTLEIVVSWFDEPRRLAR
jgi:hypothetical protein